MPRRVFVAPLLCLAALNLASLPAAAGDRAFTYVYEATTHAQGAWEIEQWVTWKTDKDTDPDFDRIDFRTELEYGITDHLQLGLYLADLRYEDGTNVADDGLEYHNAAAELIWNLTNPTLDPLGLALYGEVKFGDELFELEGKILAQKNISNVILAYNATIEAEWEGENYDEDKGVFEQTFGASYQFSPSFSAGVEALHEIEFDDWSETGDDVVYLGPNASYRADGWWVTVTPLFQVTDEAGEANFQTRMIFGMDF